MATPYDSSSPITTLFSQIEEAVVYAEAGQTITMSLTAIPMDAHTTQHTLVFHVYERRRVTTTLLCCTINCAVALDGVLSRPDKV